MSNIPPTDLIEEEIQDASIGEDEEASTDVRYQVSSYGADYPVDGLVKRLINDDIILPKFQREFVWPQTQASKFIESLLLGLPVPAIFLSKDVSTQKLQVIDGQQRLKSLKFFYEGVFHKKAFSLIGVNKEFEGSTYKSLKDEDRRRLDDAIIHAIIIRQDDPRNDDSSDFLVFERLNTTSTPLSEQEIRACVCHGSFNEYLHKANENSAWRAIYGDVNTRQKDTELLLRFFALYFDFASYERPMKLFLTRYMKKNRNLNLHSADILDKVFKPTIELANNQLGRETFRPQRALNASVTDSILVGTAKRLATGSISNLAGYKNAIQQAIQSPQFMDLYRGGTTNKDRLESRIKCIVDALATLQ